MVNVPGFPSMKAKKMLRILRKLGYVVETQEGSHRQMVAPGLQKITFAYHDSRELSPVEVRNVLVKNVGLSYEEAKQVVK